MPINATYRFAQSIHHVIVDGNNVMFLNSDGVISTIEGIGLNKAGVLKEFPDLEHEPEWRRIAIERFKAKIKSFNTEMDVTNYVKDELTRWGHEALMYQRAGFRPSKFSK